MGIVQKEKVFLLPVPRRLEDLDPTAKCLMQRTLKTLTLISVIFNHSSTHKISILQPPPNKEYAGCWWLLISSRALCNLPMYDRKGGKSKK